MGPSGAGKYRILETVQKYIAVLKCSTSFQYRQNYAVGHFNGLHNEFGQWNNHCERPLQGFKAVSLSICLRNARVSITSASHRLGGFIFFHQPENRLTVKT